MTCGHGVQAVTAELTLPSGWRDVQVDLTTGGLSMASDEPLSLDGVLAAAEVAGYELAGVDG